MSTPSTASDFAIADKTPLLARPHLFVALHGGDPVGSMPSRHLLHGVDEVVIGRSSARGVARVVENGCTRLELALADSRVSAAHARLSCAHGAWVVEDLGSKNGTLVNGAHAAGARLVDGDCVQIGQTLLVLRTAMATPRSTATDLEATARAPGLATLVPSLAHELDLLATVATRPIPILLLSETGTGKDVLARAIHALSRRPGSFVPVNCAALPPALVESVLFGHRRGAFSGAVSDQPGLLRAAHGGTMLLDEVGDMNAAVQATLLRVLQDGEVLPVGGTKTTRVDVRVVSATHHDLEASVRDGSFREDLLARLSGFTFRLPPLRERREDIGLLVGTLLRRSPTGASCTLSPEAALLLLRYGWPRNVRELEKALALAIAIAGDGRIEPDHLPQCIRHAGVEVPLPSAGDELRGRIVGVLERSRGNVSSVAAAMHTSRSQVHRWLKRFAIDPEVFRGR